MITVIFTGISAIRRKITDTLARTARCPEDKRDIIIRDTELRGFGLRVSKNTTAFIFESSRVPRRTIGQFPAWTAADAREAAAEIRREADAAGTVLPRRKTMADVWARHQETGFAALSKIEQKARRRYVERYILPAIGKTALSHVTFADCEDIHRSVPKPYAANRCLATLRRLFELAVKWQWCDRNPARGVEPNPEHPRNEYLTPAQIEAIFAVLPVDGPGDLTRMLLLSGCRPGEARTMTWSQVDIENGIWTKPATGTKQRREHRVPLSPAAVEIIRRQPVRGPLVFLQESGQPVKSAMLFKRWKQALRKAGVPPMRLYTCRHSLASLLASNGVSLPVVGAVLGHATVKSTARYAHLYDSEVRRAVEIVAFPTGKTR